MEATNYGAFYISHLLLHANKNFDQVDLDVHLKINDLLVK